MEVINFFITIAAPAVCLLLAFGVVTLVGWGINRWQRRSSRHSRKSSS